MKNLFFYHTIVHSQQTQAPGMANGSIVATETQKCQREAHNEFTQKIDEVVSNFITRLNGIAEKHRQFFFFFLFLCHIDG